MCSRYTLRRRLQDVGLLFRVPLGPGVAAMPPRYNVAPSQPVGVVARNERGQVDLRLMRWGLVPHWAKDLAIGTKLLNARIETVTEKPSFRDAMKYRRCLIPADGFYEWTTATDGKKQPHLIHRPDDGVFAFAGLWEHWQDADGNELETCAIVTTASDGVVARLHDRMPVIVDPAAGMRWIEAGPPEDALAVIRASPPVPLTTRRVSRRVNRPGVDDPQCVLAPPDEPSGESPLLF